jgi:hypothetical protein
MGNQSELIQKATNRVTGSGTHKRWGLVIKYENGQYLSTQFMRKDLFNVSKRIGYYLLETIEDPCTGSAHRGLLGSRIPAEKARASNL